MNLVILKKRKNETGFPARAASNLVNSDCQKCISLPLTTLLATGYLKRLAPSKPVMSSMMKRYDPSQTPNPEEWQALDELLRINLVQEYHKESGEDIPEDSEKIHAVIHVIVENQLALGVEPVPATIKKLTRQGLDRHEAIHAIGAVLSEDIFEVLHGKEEALTPQRYRKRLEKFTAKRWRKGKW